MNRRNETIPASYFDTVYQADSDPWKFRSSAYERAKYAHTLAAMSRPRFARALEVGCSIGVFTADLALRCDHVLAIDASDVALASARQACSAVANVTFETRMVPREFPSGQFDLIVLSEVLYYLQPSDLEAVAVCCLDALPSDGELILCHWLNETDYPLSGAMASDLFAAAVAKRLPVRHVLNDRTYRLERLACGPEGTSA